MTVRATASTRSAGERFGDPSLVSDEVLPLAPDERRLGAPLLVGAWAAVAVGPGLWGAAVRHVALPVPAVLTAVAAGGLAAALTGLVLGSSAGRYGIGAAITSRAAFGSRGAALPALARWGVGTVWLAGWAFVVAMWSRRLLVVALEGTELEDSVLYRAISWHLPFEGAPAGMTWLLAALLCWLAVEIAGAELRARARVSLVATILVVASSAGLVVLAGMRSKGFGPWLRRDDPWDGPALAGAALSVYLATLPAVITCGDWMRAQRKARGMIEARAAPFALVGAGLVVAAFGALVASAAHTILGTVDGDAIADGARVGSLLGGGIGVALSLAAWIALAPVVGVHSSAMAIVGLAPARLRVRGMGWLTALAAALAVPGVAFAQQHGVPVEAACAVLLAPLGVLVADALLVRRGRLTLEDAYLRRGAFGPVGGCTISALVGVLVGWAMLPLAWGMVGTGAVTVLDSVASGAWRPLVLAAASVVVPAVVYALGAPIERRLTRRVGRAMVALGERRDEKRREARTPRWLGPESSKLEDTTNPNFIYESGGPGAARDGEPVGERGGRADRAGDDGDRIPADVSGWDDDD